MTVITYVVDPASAWWCLCSEGLHPTDFQWIWLLIDSRSLCVNKLKMHHRRLLSHLYVVAEGQLVSNIPNTWSCWETFNKRQWKSEEVVSSSWGRKREGRPTMQQEDAVDIHRGRTGLSRYRCSVTFSLIMKDSSSSLSVKYRNSV